MWEQTSFAQARPPLLQTLENLFCAIDSAAAKQQLDKLFNISAPDQRWPDEWLGTQANQASLHAGTLDLALLALQQTALRFPNLRETAEQVALQWDYCEVLEEQKFYNLSWQAARLSKTLAAEPASKWAGFRQWGFLRADPSDRFVPIILDEMRIAPSAYHLLLHRIYRQQCFPHPETGLLAREEATPDPAHIREALAFIPEQKQIPYPFVWQPICLGKPRKTLHEAMPVTKPSQPVVTEQPAVKKPESRITPLRANDQRLMIPISIVLLEPSTKTKLAPSTKRLQSKAKGQGAKGKVGDLPKQKKTKVRKKRLKSAPQRVRSAKKKPAMAQPHNKREVFSRINQTTKQRPSLQKKKIPSPPPDTLPLDSLLPAIVEPQASGKIPVYLEPETKLKPPTKAQVKPKTQAKIQAHGTTGIIKGAKGQKNGRLAASLGHSISLKDGSPSLSAGVTWSPQANWFISGNASLKDSELSYAWSVGYADYKPGGWSAQLNNWGPIHPNQGLALDKASLNFGHKFKSIPLENYKLTASGNLSVPIKGKPSLSGSLQWNPKPNWSVRTTASVPLKGKKKLNWHYAVGYSNPSILGKWKLEYSNYGTNAFPGDNLKEGTLSVTRSW